MMSKQFSKDHIENAVTYITFGGMCDRLYNIASLYAETSRMNKRLNVIWIKNAACGCFYTEIFEPLDNMIVFSNAPDFLIPPAKLWSFNDLNDVRRVAIMLDKPLWGSLVQCTVRRRVFDRYICHTKHQNRQPFEDAVMVAVKEKHASVCIVGVVRWIADFCSFDPPFRLQEPLHEKVLRLTEAWDESVIGIHARHYEPTPFSDSQITTSVVTAVMKSEIGKNGSARFFLATDSEVTRQKLMQTFGDRIITQAGEVLGRESEEGMKRAVVDLYALARTNKIIGVGRSGFAIYASRLGKTPLVEASVPSQNTILLRQTYAGT